MAVLQEISAVRKYREKNAPFLALDNRYNSGANRSKETRGLCNRAFCEEVLLAGSTAG